MREANVNGKCAIFQVSDNKGVSVFIFFDICGNIDLSFDMVEKLCRFLHNLRNKLCKNIRFPLAKGCVMHYNINGI